jgi:hypothetical protein
MKHDETYYDGIQLLAYKYRKTPWWKWIRRLKLRRVMHTRWGHFIQEVSDERESTGGDPS